MTCPNSPTRKCRMLSRSRKQRSDGTWTEWVRNCSWCGRRETT